MIEFLNYNSGAILALATVVLVIVTGVYAVITGLMLCESKRMRKTSTEPFIFINIQSSEGARFLKKLVIHNIGAGPAYNLSFNIAPDIIILGRAKLSEKNFMREGINNLAPNQKVESLIANSMEEANKKEKLVYQMTVKYRGNYSKYEHTYPLDFTESIDLPYTETDPYKGIIDKLDKIHNDLNHVTGGIPRKVRVVAYTKDEDQDQTKRYSEEMKELSRKNPDSPESPAGSAEK